MRNKYVTKDSASEFFREWMFESPKEVRAYSLRQLVSNYKTCFKNNTKFNDEKNKINNILKIVKNNINIVYDKIKQKHKTKDKVDESIKHINTRSHAKYKTKSTDVDDKFKDIL